METNALQPERGKLKIFIGSAPGVGKTYSMLKAAKFRKEENIDVVIGIVETHERADTKALLSDIELISLKSVIYKELIFWELDIDKIIERKPQIILIDELAHSNVKGSKHKKRYLDIEEILTAGIDVYTTVNIQHLESLNDLVSGILQINVHETVPDYIIKQADEILLIDLPPNELRKRLKEGKIYKKEKITQALNNFFAIEKLIALREIALNYTAQSVNAQMLNYIQYQQVKNFHPTREKLMVCIDNSNKAFKLIRECSRAANFNKISWITLHVDITDTSNIRDNINSAMQLTEELGGQAIIIKAQDVVDEIISTATSQNITRIIVGKKSFKWWDVKPSVADKLITKTEIFEISIVPIQTQNSYVKNTENLLKKPLLFRSMQASLIVILFFILNIKYQSYINAYIYEFVIILMSILIGAKLGSLYGIYSLSLNMILEIIKYDSFKVQNITKYIFYLFIVYGMNYVADKFKQNIYLIKKTINHLNNLYEFNTKLMESSNLDEIILGLEECMLRLGYTSINIVLAEDGKLVNNLKNKTENIDYEVAEWSWLHNKASGSTTSTFPDSLWFAMPIYSKNNNFGVLALYIKNKNELSFHRKKLLQIICNLTAMTIQKIQMNLL